MSRNNVRGPTSALTEFLRESGITPTTIARRVATADAANSNHPVAGPSNAGQNGDEQTGEDDENDGQTSPRRRIRTRVSQMQIGPTAVLMSFNRLRVTARMIWTNPTKKRRRPRNASSQKPRKRNRKQRKRLKARRRRKAARVMMIRKPTRRTHIQPYLGLLGVGLLLPSLPLAILRHALSAKKSSLSYVTVNWPFVTHLTRFFYADQVHNGCEPRPRFSLSQMRQRVRCRPIQEARSAKEAQGPVGQTYRREL
jgi:hypothetical protein